MDAQAFLYWALGGGVILLVLFICAAIFYLIRILKDISEATASVRDTAETVNENVQEIADKVTGATDQVLNYFVKPFAMFQFFADKVKPFVDMMQPKDSGNDDDEEKPKKRTKRRRKKD